jgi:YVTN family beta-propeller protein
VGHSWDAVVRTADQIRAICVTAGRYIYTTNYEDNTVSVIDAATNQVIDTIKTGKAPTSIDFVPSGRRAYVFDEGSGRVEVLGNLPQ